MGLRGMVIISPISHLRSLTHQSVPANISFSPHADPRFRGVLTGHMCSYRSLNKENFHDYLNSLTAIDNYCLYHFAVQISRRRLSGLSVLPLGKSFRRLQPLYPAIMND